jgi:hypothetical protein
MSVVVSVSSVFAKAIAAANAQENWDIDHLLSAVSFSITNYVASYDVSNLGVAEGEQLYRFLTTTRNVFSEHEWTVVGQVADELVRFQGSVFCCPFETSELLNNIHIWYFAEDSLDEEDDADWFNACRDAALQHETIFGIPSA